MPKTPDQFKKKYPDFFGLADDFADPPPSHTSDEETARKIRSEWPVSDRIDIFKRLLSDSDRLLSSIESDWKSMCIFVNRAFRSSGETKKWVLTLQSVWRDELARLEK